MLIVVKGLGTATKKYKITTHCLNVTNRKGDLGKVKETSGIDKKASTILRN